MTLCHACAKHDSVLIFNYKDDSQGIVKNTNKKYVNSLRALLFWYRLSSMIVLLEMRM